MSKNFLIEWMDKPWGRHTVIHNNESGWAVKLLDIKAGEALSVQRHKYRSEFWTVLVGSCVAGCWQDGEEERWVSLNEGDKFSIPSGHIHGVEAVSDTLILEVIEGQYLDEDIVRISDRYGR